MARILVVDDSAVDRAHVIGLLRKEGHQALEAEDGKRALELAHSEHPDLILMDIVMPEMEGFAATRRLMSDPQTRDIPVIMLSSKAQNSDRFRANQMGARAYLVKPVDAATLRAQLRTWLG